MPYKPKVYLTSNVFSSEEIGSNEKISQKLREEIKSLWEKITESAEIKIFNGRFPNNGQIKKETQEFNPEIIGYAGD